MSSITSFEDLMAWQSARWLVKAVYEATTDIGLKTDYAFKDQLQRAAISIAANIAEGFERGGNKEFLYFLSVAKGSAGEVKSLLISAGDCGLLRLELQGKLISHTNETLNLIGGLIRHLKASDLQGVRKKRPKM